MLNYYDLNLLSLDFLDRSKMKYHLNYYKKDQSPTYLSYSLLTTEKHS